MHIFDGGKKNCHGFFYLKDKRLHFNSIMFTDLQLNTIISFFNDFFIYNSLVSLSEEWAIPASKL